MRNAEALRDGYIAACYQQFADNFIIGLQESSKRKAFPPETLIQPRNPIEWAIQFSQGRRTLVRKPGNLYVYSPLKDPLNR